MKNAEVLANLGNVVSVTGEGDLYCDGWLRPVIGKNVHLIRIAKSGLAIVWYDKVHYSVPQRNLAPKII